MVTHNFEFKNSMFYLDLVHFKILFVQGIIFCQNLIVNLKKRLLPLERAEYQIF